MWYYKIIEHEDHAELVEFFPNLGRQLFDDGVTKEILQEDGMTEPIIIGDTQEDIHQTLIMMLHDTTAKSTHGQLRRFAELLELENRATH